MIPSFAYIRARSLDEAVRYLSLDGARTHAGGTDLLGCLRERIFDVATVVSIAGLKELAGIRETPAGGLRIGALTTIAEIARHPVIRSKYRALSMAASEVASPSCATRVPSAATSARSPAAGTTGENSTACEKAAISALPSRAKTLTTASSAVRTASSSIPQIQHRPW